MTNQVPNKSHKIFLKDFFCNFVGLMLIIKCYIFYYPLFSEVAIVFFSVLYPGMGLLVFSSVCFGGVWAKIGTELI